MQSNEKTMEPTYECKKRKYLIPPFEFQCNIINTNEWEKCVCFTILFLTSQKKGQSDHRWLSNTPFSNANKYFLDHCIKSRQARQYLSLLEKARADLG